MAKLFCDKYISFNNLQITDELNILSNVNSKNIIVTGADSRIRTNLVLSYVKEHMDEYDNVIYAVFDKEKYLFYDKESIISTDCILKKCITKHFIGMSNNNLEYFENLLNLNTLVIVDKYSIKAPSPYMRHLAKSPCRLIVLSEHEMESVGNDFFCMRLQKNTGVEKYDINTLSEKEKELLCTLSAMVYYSDGIDLETAKFYFGDLFNCLSGLVNLGFVNIDSNERIVVDSNLVNFTLKEFKPDFDNCNGFMSVIKDVACFDIDMFEKDVNGRLRIDCDHKDTIVDRSDFLDIYSFFAKNDKHSVKYIYNSLISNILLNDGNAGSDHLKIRSRCFYVRYLYENLRGDNALEIYRSCAEEYSIDVDILAKLDVLRICVSFIRNMTFDLYDESKEILKVLHDVMNELYNIIEGLTDDELKEQLLDDCIRISGETFMYFETVDKDGVFNCSRVNYKKGTIHYSCEKYSNSVNAVSLAFGYSTLTVSLYGLFQKYLVAWLNSCENKNLTFENPVIREIVFENIKVRKSLVESVSREFLRIIKGYDNFYDFYDAGSINYMILPLEISDDILKERLDKNLRLMERGFDNGLKTSAERYSKQIVETLKISKHPEKLLRLIFNPDYPLSDYCFKSLSDNGFVRVAVCNKNISNLSKQKLLLFFVDIFNEVTMGDGRKEIVKELIALLSTEIHYTETFSEKLFFVTCGMYLENKTWKLSNDNDFSDILFEKFCMGKEIKNETAEIYVAKLLYQTLNGNKTKINKNKTFNAFKAIVFEYFGFKNNFNAEGLIIMVETFCTKEHAQKFKEIINSYC